MIFLFLFRCCFNWGIEIFRVIFEPVQVNFPFMKVREEHDVSVGFLRGIDCNISETMALDWVNRSISTNFLVFSKNENAVIKIEKVSFFVHLIISWLDEIISDFDDFVVEVDMTIHEGVKTRLKPPNKRLIFDRLLKQHLLRFKFIDFEWVTRFFLLLLWSFEKDYEPIFAVVIVERLNVM